MQEGFGVAAQKYLSYAKNQGRQLLVCRSVPKASLYAVSPYRKVNESRKYIQTVERQKLTGFVKLASNSRRLENLSHSHSITKTNRSLRVSFIQATQKASQFQFPVNFRAFEAYENLHGQFQFHKKPSGVPLKWLDFG